MHKCLLFIISSQKRILNLNYFVAQFQLLCTITDTNSRFLLIFYKFNSEANMKMIITYRHVYKTYKQSVGKITRCTKIVNVQSVT